MKFRVEPYATGPLRVFVAPQKGRRYVIGGDPAAGETDKDFSAATVCDAEHGSIVAAYSAHVPPSPFADELCALGWYYAADDGTPAFMVPERNNHGIALIDALLRLGYPHIYTRRVWDDASASWVSKLGFATSMVSKPILINRGRIALANPNCVIRDIHVLRQMGTWVRNETGREVPLAGCYDDSLMSYLLALEGIATLYDRGSQQFSGTEDGAEPDRPPKVEPWQWKAMRKHQREMQRRKSRYIQPIGRSRR